MNRETTRVSKRNGKRHACRHACPSRRVAKADAGAVHSVEQAYRFLRNVERRLGYKVGMAWFTIDSLKRGLIMPPAKAKR